MYHYVIYCIEVWGSASQMHLRPLVLVHKKIERIITFSHYLAHTQPLFIDLFLLPLDKFLLNRIGTIMYKICNDLLPEVIKVLYVRNKDINSYSTRSSNTEITQGFNKLCKYQYSIVECVTVEY